MNTNRIPTHPGDVIKEELEYRGISQKKFSELTEEEQKLFSDNDYYQENKNIW